MWSVWDKKSDINGFSVERFVAKHRHLQNEETIFVKTVEGVVTQVESKGVLAKVYGVDYNLPNDEFIAEYERILSERVEEPTEEV